MRFAGVSWTHETPTGTATRTRYDHHGEGRGMWARSLDLGRIEECASEVTGFRRIRGAPRASGGSNGVLQCSTARAPRLTPWQIAVTHACPIGQLQPGRRRPDSRNWNLPPIRGIPCQKIGRSCTMPVTQGSPCIPVGRFGSTGLRPVRVSPTTAIKPLVDLPRSQHTELAAGSLDQHLSPSPRAMDRSKAAPQCRRSAATIGFACARLSSIGTA